MYMYNYFLATAIVLMWYRTTQIQDTLLVHVACDVHVLFIFAHVHTSLVHLVLVLQFTRMPFNMHV